MEYGIQYMMKREVSSIKKNMVYRQYIKKINANQSCEL